MSKMFESGETIDERLERIVDEYCEGEYLRGYDLEWLVYNVHQLKISKDENKRYREALVRLRNDINKQETGYEKNVFVIRIVDDALIDWEALEGEE